MPGLRIVLVILAVIAVIFIARQLMSSRKSQRAVDVEPARPGQVIACKQCGVHVPASELSEQNGRRVCRQCLK